MTKRSGFILAGTASNVGKTTVTAAVLQTLVQRGLKVQSYKCGPDYLDPTFHSFITKRPSINLDVHLMPEAQMRSSFLRHSGGADCLVIEGVMGLYDGWDHGFENGSAAHLSRLLGVPVVLIVDGSGVSTSVAAMVKGFMGLDSRVNIAGVILNKVGSKGHADLLGDAILRYTGVPVVGYVPVQGDFALESRHLGLKPAHEIEALSRSLRDLATSVATTLDFELLLGLGVDLDGPEGSESPEGLGMAVEAIKQVKPRFRVGLARDRAFYFYYQDNLDLMERLGMELVNFSPMDDQGLPPDLDALYFGGGYPELHCEALSGNVAMRREILEFSQSGKPIYGECGGMMYLCSSMEDMSGTTYPMVGALKGRAAMTNRLQRFGYVNVTLQAPSLFAPQGNLAGGLLKGHEFHRSLVEWDPDQQLIYGVERAFGSGSGSGSGGGARSGWTCGAQTLNTLGAYAHLHFQSNPGLLGPWIALMEKNAASNDDTISKDKGMVK